MKQEIEQKKLISKRHRLEKPMRKVQVSNFTTVNFLKKNKSRQALKLAKAKGTQYLFGRLLFLSFQQK